MASFNSQNEMMMAFAQFYMDNFGTQFDLILDDEGASSGEPAVLSDGAEVSVCSPVPTASPGNPMISIRILMGSERARAFFKDAVLPPAGVAPATFFGQNLTVYQLDGPTMLVRDHLMAVGPKLFVATGAHHCVRVLIDGMVEIG